MKRSSILGTVLLLTMTACGGSGDEADSSSDAAASVDDAGGSTDAEIVDAQPPGQAMASVEGLNFTLGDEGALSCSVSDDSITFSFRIGDNEITLGGGANRTDDEWFGGFDLRVANPENEPGPVSYFPDLPSSSAGMAVSGDSFSYSGPMLKQVANDGTNPPPVAAGDGVITLTCP